MPLALLPAARVLAGKCCCSAAEGHAVRCTTQNPCHTLVSLCRLQQPVSHFARGHHSLEAVIVVIRVISITLPVVLVVLLLLTVPWRLLPAGRPLLLPLLPLPPVLLRWVPAPAGSSTSPTTAAASASAVVSAVSAPAASAVAAFAVAPGTREGARAAVAP